MDPIGAWRQRMLGDFKDMEPDRWMLFRVRLGRCGLCLKCLPATYKRFYICFPSPEEALRENEPAPKFVWFDQDPDPDLDPD